MPPTASQKNAINYPKAFPTALRSTCQSSMADHCSMKASGVFEDNHKTINSKPKNISTNNKSEVQLSKMLEYWLLPAFAVKMQISQSKYSEVGVKFLLNFRREKMANGQRFSLTLSCLINVINQCHEGKHLVGQEVLKAMASWRPNKKML